MLFDNSTYHYPPELMTLLVQTIPLLCKSKKDVLLFFRGAGTKDFYISDLSRIVERNKDSITKYEITRDILTRLNEAKDKELATRREILKRIVEFDSFASCWDSDVLKAKGCVSEVQKIVNVKDSFTRMKIEREEERKRNIDKHTKEIEAIKEKNKSFEEIKQKFYALFSSNNPQERGRELEKVLNSLFKLGDIGIKESFTVSVEDTGVYEQIDGAIEIDGNIYLVEMKWRKTPTDVNDVSRHLVRMFSRHDGKGIFISYAPYTDAAIQTCKESLSKATIVLCLIQEIVQLLENKDDLKEFLRMKIHGTVLNKTPFTPYQ